MAIKSSYLYGWDKPKEIAKSSPTIILGLAKILQRYSMEASDRGTKYCVRNTGLLGDSIEDKPDPTNMLIRWIGSNFPYMEKIEYLWKKGLPQSHNKNSSATPHPLQRGILDVRDKFKDACNKGMRGEWEKI